MTAARSLEDITLEPATYSADLVVNERAQTLAAEIVPLGLLAIGGIGFLLADLSVPVLPPSSSRTATLASASSRLSIFPQ